MMMYDTYDLLALRDLEFRHLANQPLQIKPIDGGSIITISHSLKDTPATRSLTWILHNYEYLKQEFESSSHPLFGSIGEAKKHKTKIEKEIKDLKSARDTVKIFKDKATVNRLSRLIKIFEMMLDDPDSLISKLIYFELQHDAIIRGGINMLPNFKQFVPSMFSSNPMLDVHVETFDDVKIYVDALRMVEGHNLANTIIFNSTVIKAYKNYEITYGKEFCKKTEFKNAFESVFAKIGEPVTLSKYDFSKVYLKTFFRKIAVFDFKTNEYQRDADEDFWKSLIQSFYSSRTEHIANGNWEIGLAKIESLKEQDKRDYFTI